VVLLSSLTTVTAQNTLEALLNPQMGQLTTTLSASARSDDKAKTKEQDNNIRLSSYEFHLTTPLRQDPNSELALIVGYSNLNFSTAARLTDADVSLPDDFSNPYIGVFYRKNLDDGKMFGLHTTLGSPSDKPFDSSREIALDASVFLRVPAQGHNAWFYFLNYSNTRDFLNNIPIPGIAYSRYHNRQLQTLIGVPLSTVRWTPTDKITAQAAYILMRTLHAKASYKLSDALSIYTAFDWQNKSYLRANRDDRDDRLLYYEKQILAGIDWTFSKNVKLNLHGGYSFDRFIYEGEDYDDRDQNRISITDGPFAAITTHLKF
jgi:hypothetical protein